MYYPFGGSQDSYYNMLSGIASLYGSPYQSPYYSYGLRAPGLPRTPTIQERVASGINPDEMATGFSNTLGPQMINQPMFPQPVQPGVQPVEDRALRSEVQPEDQLSGDNILRSGVQPSNDTTLRSAVQPGVQPISGSGQFGGGYYGAGRTGNPYTIGTGGMPYTTGYFRSQFGNPYSGGFGGKGGMARPSYGKGGSF